MVLDNDWLIPTFSDSSSARVIGSFSRRHQEAGALGPLRWAERLLRGNSLVDVRTVLIGQSGLGRLAVHFEIFGNREPRHWVTNALLSGTRERGCVCIRVF